MSQKHVKGATNQQPAQVGQVRDPKTGQMIPVFPRKGESSEHAIERVRAKHSK